MKKLIIIAICFLTNAAFAGPDIFESYEQLAKKIVADVKMGSATIGDFKTLVGMGYTIMDLFVTKFPECKVQYAQVKSEDAQMQTMTFENIHIRYHNGEGLPTAPGLCYAGRSMAVHPYMAIALIRESKPGADEEIQEVAVRAPKIKARLAR